MKFILNKLINQLLKRYYYHKNSSSNIYTRTITKKTIKRLIDDEALYFNEYSKYINWNLNYAKQFDNKIILEFGVAKGQSGKVISDFFSSETVYGFDSFMGFKKIDKKSFWSYQGYQKNFQDQKIPAINENYKIINGYVEDTLQNFMKEVKIDNFDTFFIHLDLDIYEPTKYVLSEILKKKKKTIIMFDELLNYPGFENHEYRALFEEVIKKNYKYRFLSFTDRGNSNYGSLIKTFIEIN